MQKEENEPNLPAVKNFYKNKHTVRGDLILQSIKIVRLRANKQFIVKDAVKKDEELCRNKAS